MRLNTTAVPSLPIEGQKAKDSKAIAASMNENSRSFGVNVAAKSPKKQTHSCVWNTLSKILRFVLCSLLSRKVNYHQP